MQLVRFLFKIKYKKKKNIKKTQAHKKTVYSQGNLFVLATNL